MTARDVAMSLPTRDVTGYHDILTTREVIMETRDVTTTTRNVTMIARGFTMKCRESRKNFEKIWKQIICLYIVTKIN